MLTWLAGSPGVDPDRIAIGGASAGGGLTAALAFLARDRGDVTPVLQVLSYPMLDDRTTDPPSTRPDSGCGTPPATGSAGPPIWAARIPRWRCRPGAPISPACRRPGWGSEHWTSSTTRTSPTPRLNAAGVPCEGTRFPGAFHGFDGIAPKAPISQAYFDSTCAGLSRALERADPMSLAFNQEQGDLRDAVADLLTKRSPEAEVRRLMAAKSGYDDAVWAELADGSARTDHPRGVRRRGRGIGGTGRGLRADGRSLLCAPYLPTAVHPYLLAALDDTAECAEALPRIAAGDLIATGLRRGRIGPSGRASGHHRHRGRRLAALRREDLRA